MIPALLVGLLTAWHLGVRAGVVAAAVSFAMMVIGNLVPGWGYPTYGLILAWCGLLYFFGDKLAGNSRATSDAAASRSKRQASRGLKNDPSVKVAKQVGSAISWAKRRVDDLIK